jgi:hypothetical protein
MTTKPNKDGDSSKKTKIELSGKIKLKINKDVNPSKKTQVKQSASDQAKKSLTIKNDLLDTLDAFFARKEKLFLYLGLGLTALFAILLFDVKVGPGGDDSAYITRAYDFVHEFKYPGYQGALYPLVLSPFVWIFGVNLPLLKGLSLIFMLVSMYFFYKAFSLGKMPQTIVTLSFILLSFNYYLLYFSSQTYSEAFFLMIQAIFFWFMASRCINDTSDKKPLKTYLLLGLLLFLLSLTKNIAYAAIVAVVAYFILYGQWKSILLTLAGFFTFFIPFEIIKRLIWGTAGLQFSSQGSGLLYKNFYNPSMGKENLAGFVQRFLDNSNLYFSKHLFRFLGLRSEDLTEKIPLLTIFTWGLLILALYLAFRKNRLIMLISVYTITLCMATFLAIQATWDQWRIVIIAFPLILVLIFSFFYYITKTSNLKGFQFSVPLLAIIIFFSSFSVTRDKAKVQKEILSHNLSGDLLYGLTPDWRNYIQMSIWAARNTPKEFFTGVRKADISFIYGERKFYGITKIPSIMSDSLLKLMPDPEVYIGIRMEKIINTSLFADPSFRTKLLGVVNGKFSFGDKDTVDGNVVGIYRFAPSEFTVWEQRLKQTGIFYDKNIKQWVKNINTISKEYGIYLPDYLLKLLRDNKVKYLLLASLRSNPNENTGNIINTLNRYLYLIQLKYPDIFKVAHTIGTDEIAELVEINF